VCKESYVTEIDFDATVDKLKDLEEKMRQIAKKNKQFSMTDNYTSDIIHIMDVLRILQPFSK